MAASSEPLLSAAGKQSCTASFESAEETPAASFVSTVSTQEAPALQASTQSARASTQSARPLRASNHSVASEEPHSRVNSVAPAIAKAPDRFKNWKPGHGDFVKKHRRELWRAFKTVTAAEDCSSWGCTQCVYVPRKVDSESRQPVPIPEQATLTYREEFDRYPGATALVVLFNRQWKEEITQWVSTISFDSVHFFFTAQLVQEFFTNEAYKEFSLWLRILFSCLFILSVSLRIYFTQIGAGTLTRELKAAWKTEGFCAKIFAFKKALRNFAMSVALKMLRVPNTINDAVFRIGSERQNINVEQPEKAVIAFVSGSAVKYEHAAVTNHLWSQVIIDDMLMNLLTIIMGYTKLYEKNVVPLLTFWLRSLLSLCFTVNQLIGLNRCRDALIKHETFLRSHASSENDFFDSKGRLRNMYEHPARRGLLWLFLPKAKYAKLKQICSED